MRKSFMYDRLAAEGIISVVFLVGKSLDKYKMQNALDK